MDASRLPVRVKTGARRRCEDLMELLSEGSSPLTPGLTAQFQRVTDRKGRPTSQNTKCRQKLRGMRRTEGFHIASVAERILYQNGHMTRI